MIAHELRIGEMIFDNDLERWGTVLTINGKSESRVLEPKDKDVPISYMAGLDVCETTASKAYPIVRGKKFHGEEVCLEINVDEFDKEHNYDYYCPEYKDNCFEVELD